MLTYDAAIELKNIKQLSNHNVKGHYHTKKLNGGSTIYYFNDCSVLQINAKTCTGKAWSKWHKSFINDPVIGKGLEPVVANINVNR